MFKKILSSLVLIATFGSATANAQSDHREGLILVKVSTPPSRSGAFNHQDPQKLVSVSKAIKMEYSLEHNSRLLLTIGKIIKFQKLNSPDAYTFSTRSLEKFPEIYNNSGVTSRFHTFSFNLNVDDSVFECAAQIEFTDADWKTVKSGKAICDENMRVALGYHTIEVNNELQLK